ncbi:MAG: glycosyltransferase [Ignavibacteriaceae bacterium]
MKRPIVSVIISTYNSAGFIVGRIRNLIEQTIFNDIEMIIVNSGSQQNEEELIREYLDKYSNIKYIRTNERETIYKAWNRGIKIASGEYITNGNTDDRLVDEALEVMSNYLSANQQVALVYANQYIVNSADDYKNRENIVSKYITPEYSSLQLCYQYFAGSQSMWRSSLHFSDNIWFDENYEVAGDYDFLTKVALKYHISHMNKYLGYYYKSPQNSNKEFQNISLTVNETVRIQKEYTPKYINSLPSGFRLSLLRRFIILHALPVKVYGVIKKAGDRYYKKKIIPTRIYMTYLMSVLYEAEGQADKALKICMQYKDNEYAFILNNRINKLKS